MKIRTEQKVLGIPIDDSATSYHRVVQPLYELALKGHPVQFLGPPISQLEQYKWADILYTQCLYTPDAFSFYTEQKEEGKKIILDFDDDYINVPEDSAAPTRIIDKDTGESHEFPADMRNLYVKMFIQLADIVVVTTEALKNVYSPWAKNIAIIPNCVSEAMNRDKPKTDNDKTRILWSGSLNHLQDLNILKTPLAKLHKKYGDSIEFHFQGPFDFKSIFTEIPIVTHYVVPFEDYLDKIQEINADIFLAPLAKTPFNSARSNLKYSQMTLMKAAFVATNHGPYSAIDHEIDGMLVNSENDWVKHISHLIDVPVFRNCLVSNAAETIDSYMIKHHLNRWKKLLVS